ncbi:hypothetical protein B7463_g12716, partial [Scytalidium lignicola]
MDTPRRPLGELNVSITPHKDLDPYIRGKIIGKAEEGTSPAQITKDLKIPDSTVRDTINKAHLRNNSKSNPRPDLNPMEHVWWHLKGKVQEIQPELKELESGEAAKKALEDALVEAWNLLDDEIIGACLECVCNRRDAVIAAKGWHAK